MRKWKTSEIRVLPDQKKTNALEWISLEDFLKWFERNFDVDYNKKSHGLFVKTTAFEIIGEYNHYKKE